MNAIPQFSELHVVSDLHLGGKGTNAQIFKQGDVFAQFVQCLLSQPIETKQALVVNGDLVDFLAEPEATYFDAQGAADKLDRILRDESFVPVWSSLRKFVASPKSSLIITLGNHDLELALPWVREQLLQELSCGDAAARGRITLAFEDGGYRCRVGSANVLCVHGNEVDPWNVTDFETLRRHGRVVGRENGRRWIPNAGTKLVIDVMNGIKITYPFVDLLKPESKAVIPTLLVLDPSLIKKLGAIIPVGTRLGWDRIRMSTGFLSEDDISSMLDAQKGVNPPHLLGQMLGETFIEMRQKRPVLNLGHLLERTEARLRSKIEPLDLLGKSEDPEYLGITSALWNLVSCKGKCEVLREALEGLKTDQTFNLKTADDTYRAYDEIVDSNVDFFVTGHTHLERALPFSEGSRYYFNSGTWARLIQLTEDILSRRRFEKVVYTALTNKRDGMNALDCSDNLILLKPTIVSIWKDDKRVHGELRHFSSGRLESIDRSRFSRQFDSGN